MNTTFITPTMPDPTTTRHLAHTTITIGAPINTVWQRLTDFDTYESWNPFTYNFAYTQFTVGEELSFDVRMSARFKTTVRERFAVIEPPHAVAWTYAQATNFLDATRYQVLTPLDDHTTTYTTWEQFSGLLAPLISLLMLGQVQRGFEDVAAALKQEAESQ